MRLFNNHIPGEFANLKPFEVLDLSNNLKLGGQIRGIMGNLSRPRTLDPQMSDDYMSFLKNQIARHYSTTHSTLEHSQSSCVTALRHVSLAGADCVALETKNIGHGKAGTKKSVHRNPTDIDGQEDMKLICGKTVARKKAGKGGNARLVVKQKTK
ncbi:hypothetical protein EZV62_009081 [Acer yangbiense]|uniref:Uncharacterized protein n=1 Tax=Acer yangbiense TaxID=1000413 RepID=A0A5C7IH86_9ROSI|nr:hypothetical protein EZV62_009081 [Acer yangbiense]